MDLALKDRVALVTGGSRGLGRAICQGFAAEGAQVAINYQRAQRPADELAGEIRRTHGTAACVIQADVADSRAVAAMFDRAEHELGPINVLVNNAGTWPSALVQDMTEEGWDRTMAVNLKGSFLTCREAVRRWLERNTGGRIVNISSSAAFIGSTTGHADYAASKAGLVNFTVSLAREMGPHGIIVNAVAPGMMQTDMAQDALEKNLEHYIKRIPLGRIADPAEIAHLVVFLASERASYTTGATFDASGGLLMR